MSPELTRKKNNLFIILCGIFLTNAIIAEMIGVKIFSFERTIGLSPAHLDILGFTMDFNLTAGVIIWPIVFVTSDLINEYFGKPGVKKISYLTASFIAYSFVVIFLTMKLPPAAWWLDANSMDAEGHFFNINFAFYKIFGQGQRIIIGSLTAFLLGQLVDVYVFQKLRRITGHKKLWLRATGSTVVSQLVDSFVVLFIAFTGIFTTSQIIAIGVTNYIYKFIVAIALTPLIYAGHYTIDKYLGREHAQRISDEASDDSQSFF
ncbi:MAG: queuosine precursor transporter [Cyclobacteriaceae bacterium]|nr:queuosine precursor transporter [Cyclobacteriaceae bacterium]